MRRAALLLAAAALGAGPAAAQVRYLPQPDTLFYEGVNPYRMWIVVRGDTVGRRVREHTLDRHVWRAENGGLVAEMRTQPLDGGALRTEVLEVSPRGVVGAARDPDDHRVRRDLLLRLPAGGDLRPGLVWHDTLSDTAHVEGNAYAFRVIRELRVERIADTLGSRIAVVRGTGTLRYRDFYPAGQPGRYWWIDVSGPVRETFRFDLTRGRMAGREWWMDLRGSAGFPDRNGGMSTVPAGLLSADTTRLITPAEARALRADRPRTRMDGERRPGPAGRWVRPAHHQAPRCPLHALRDGYLGTRVAQIARSSCEGADGALLYRLVGVLAHKP